MPLSSRNRKRQEEVLNQAVLQNFVAAVPMPPYDIAISFLQKDRVLASSLARQLAATLKVFFYPRSREDLVGVSPTEMLFTPFLEGSRVIVLLYRTEWGSTDWTRMEFSAIQEGCSSQGWSKLLFVRVDCADSIPAWLAAGHIILDFEDYGVDHLVGAIKLRVQERGGAMHRCNDEPNDDPRFSKRNGWVASATQNAISRSLIQDGELEVDLNRMAVRYADRYLSVGSKELNLLNFLMKNPGHVFSRRQLVFGVWGRSAKIDPRTVDAYIRRLRRTFIAQNAPDPVRTVRGSGYALNAMSS